MGPSRCRSHTVRAQPRQIYPLLGIPGPPTGPYRISGKLERDPGVWKFVQTKWHVGDCDLSGDITVDERKKPEFLTAKLVSNNLAFKDLAPLVGAAPAIGHHEPAAGPDPAAARARGELFPNMPLHVEKLRAMNMDMTLDARKVVAPDYLPVQALSFRVVINNGVAKVTPIKLALVGAGSITGEIVSMRAPTRQGARQPHAAPTSSSKTFFRDSTLLRHHPGRRAGPCEPGRHRPLARPGHGHRRRRRRARRWPAARSRA